MRPLFSAAIFVLGATIVAGSVLRIRKDNCAEFLANVEVGERAIKITPLDSAGTEDSARAENIAFDQISLVGEIANRVNTEELKSNTKHIQKLLGLDLTLEKDQVVVFLQDQSDRQRYLHLLYEKIYQVIPEKFSSDGTESLEEQQDSDAGDADVNTKMGSVQKTVTLTRGIEQRPQAHQRLAKIFAEGAKQYNAKAGDARRVLVDEIECKQADCEEGLLNLTMVETVGMKPKKNSGGGSKTGLPPRKTDVANASSKMLVQKGARVLESLDEKNSASNLKQIQRSESDSGSLGSKTIGRF